tara:strand:- start:133 stop:351 length:219 start_codon:yes stop_codon:yes gene_type:complete
MPHDHIKLAQSPSGEIGPLCHSCSKNLTFGEAIPLNRDYLCWKCYVEITGNEPAAVPDNKAQPFYRDGSESR